jgi:hypothetical protein
VRDTRRINACREAAWCHGSRRPAPSRGPPGTRSPQRLLERSPPGNG